MSWLRVDDGFDEHDKVLDLLEEADGLAAVGLWTLCATMCSRGDGGEVTLRRARRASGQGPERVHRLADLLVSVGLWDVVEDAWEFHDWAEYRPPRRDRDDEQRRKDAARQARRRARMRDRDVTDVTKRDVTESRSVTPQSRNVTQRDESVTHHPDPTRPDPTRPAPPDPPPDAAAAEPEPKSPLAEVRPPPDPPTPSLAGDIDATELLGAPGYVPPIRRSSTVPPDLEAAPRHERIQAVVAVAEEVWRAEYGVALGLMQRRDLERARDVLTWAEASAPDDPLALIRSSWSRLTSDRERCEQMGSPWAVFASGPGKWVPAKPKPKRYRNRGSVAEAEGMLRCTFDEDERAMWRRRLDEQMALPERPAEARR